MGESYQLTARLKTTAPVLGEATQPIAFKMWNLAGEPDDVQVTPTHVSAVLQRRRRIVMGIFRFLPGTFRVLCPFHVLPYRAFRCRDGGAAITGYRIYAAAATWSAKDNAYVRSGEWEYKAEVGPRRPSAG